jgi:hypothetical protein
VDGVTVLVADGITVVVLSAGAHSLWHDRQVFLFACLLTIVQASP